jgi:hypothetical protein
LQRNCALDDQRDGNDRSEQQRPDWPSSGLDDCKQVGAPVRFPSGFLAWRKEWRDFSKNPATALSTKLVDKFVDCRWKYTPILLALSANLGPVKCSAVFSGIETARYV